MVGIDIISVVRISDFVHKFGIKALKRFLSDAEISMCVPDFYRCHSSFDIRGVNFSRVAGFWAAKEACSKALGVGIGRELGFLDMSISKSKANVPSMMLSDDKMAYFNIKQIALSISHDGGFAVAVVFCHKC